MQKNYFLLRGEARILDTYVYEYNGKDYINLTNKCTNNCTFCIRNHHNGVGVHELWLKQEPSAEQVIDILKEKKRDVVFCGFGEPMIRIDAIRKIAAYVKSYGGNVRINTNGHANAYHNRNVVPEIAPYIDIFSISLNHVDPNSYQEICRSIYGNKAFEYMLDFAKCCLNENKKVILSAMDIIGEENIKKCREIADALGAEFRERYYV